MHTKIAKREEISKAAKEVIVEIDNFRRSNIDFLKSLKTLRSSFGDKLKEKIFDVACLHIFNAEKASPGGSDFFLDFVLNETSIELQGSAARIFRKSDLESILRCYLDQEFLPFVREVLELSSFNSKILVKEDTHDQSLSIVEKNNSFYFEGLRPSYLLRNNKVKDVRVCPIDGFIESVSEIHFLLEKISTLQEPCILFVRGHSEDVSHTLKVNYERNKITCIPVVVNFDIEGANLLNDIAIISGSDVVSSFKGETINSIDIEKFPRIDSAIFLPNGISLDNKISNERVKSHINFVVQKIENSDSSASEDALTRRLQRLSGGQITVSLSKDHKKRKLSLDKALRAVQMAKSFGVVEYNEKTFPKSTIEAGKTFSSKFKDTIESIGCIVI